MFEYLKKYGALALILLVLVGIGYAYHRVSSYENALADLRNQVAAKDKTIEEQKSEFVKLATENDKLKSSNGDLQKLLDKTKQDVIAESQLSAYWKNRLDFELGHKPVPVGPGSTEPAKPGICTENYQTYRGEQDIGLVKLTVDTTTIDPSYKTHLTVSPGSKPLKLTLDLTRDQKKQWRTHVISSDENIGVDIGVNSVNLEPLEEHWYERLKLNGDLALDLRGSGGILAGVGVSYEFGQWELGPKVFANTNKNTYLGMGFAWAPFKSK